MPAVLEQFIPRPDMQDRRQIVIRAPAAMVLEVARNFDLQLIFLIRAIFWLRAKMLGAKTETQCAKPTAETDQCLWFGDNTRQGIAVFANGPYRRPLLVAVADHANRKILTQNSQFR